MRKGFTLIELVVALGIMAIIGLALTAALTQTLRGENKAQLINQVKQNGQNILDKMTASIREASEVVCPVSGTSSSLVVYKPGLYTQFYFVAEAPGVSGSNSIINFKEDSTALDCTSQARNSSPLNNMDTKNGVSVSSLPGGNIFSVDNAGSSKIITIKFKAKPPVAAGQTQEAQIGSDGIEFATSVQLKGGSQN